MPYAPYVQYQMKHLKVIEKPLKSKKGNSYIWTIYLTTLKINTVSSLFSTIWNSLQIKKIIILKILNSINSTC